MHTRTMGVILNAEYEVEVLRKRVAALLAELSKQDETLATLDALADQWIALGVMRSVSATTSANRGRELRAILDT